MIFKLWSEACQQGWWPTFFLANQHMVGISSNWQLVYSFAVSIWHKMGSWKIPGMEWTCQFSQHPFPKGGAVSALMLTMYTACSWKMWGLRSRWWRWQTVVIVQAWLIFWFSFWFTVWIRLVNELVERWYTSVKMGKEPQTIQQRRQWEILQASTCCFSNAWKQYLLFHPLWQSWCTKCWMKFPSLNTLQTRLCRQQGKDKCWESIDEPDSAVEWFLAEGLQWSESTKED